ncbi:MAG: hypothetical protein U1E34_12180 [Amaricoccus sp.]
MRLALCLSLLAAPCLAGEAATPVSVGGFASPESVLLVGDHAYVSNIGPVLDPLAKDGDGFISLLAADGTVLARHALPADGTRLDAPKGMARIGGTLYVADIDRVVGFDLASGARLSVAELPGGDPSLANDLAAEPGGTLLVSDTLRNALYRLDPETGIWTLLTDGLPGANGIAIRPDGGIVVVGVGAGFAGGDTYALREGAAPERVAGGPHGLLDGVAIAPDGTVLVSDWVAFDPPAPGRLVAVAQNGSTAPVAAGTPLHGPADFALGPDGRLWVPEMPENRVTILPAAE